MPVRIRPGNRLRAAALDLESRIYVLRGMATPGDRQVGGESVVIQRVGQNGADRRARILEAGGPAFGDRVGIDPGRGRGDAVAGPSRTRDPPTVLDNGKAERPALGVVEAEVLIVHEFALLLLQQPRTRFGEFLGSDRTEEHRDGQAIILESRNHGVGHIPGIVADVSEGRQPTPSVIERVQVCRNGPLPKVGEAVGLERPPFGTGQGREKQARENRNDRDDHEKLDQGEGPRRHRTVHTGEHVED